VTTRTGRGHSVPRDTSGSAKDPNLPERSTVLRVLLAGATGVIGRQAVPVLAAAGHQVIGLARIPIQLPDAEVIVHMLTAVPDPIDSRHLARDMALTNRLRTQGTANLLAAGGARMIAQGVAYAYDPAESPVNDEDAPLWHHPPAE